MDYTFALKIILTPTLIGAVSLAGRRWGPSVSGWLVGLPLTSGPITLFLALSLGSTFARSTALGTLLGIASQAVVCLTYAWCSKRWTWPVSLAVSIAVFSASTWLLHGLHLPLAQLYALIVVFLSSILEMMPREQIVGQSQSSPPRWDLPARMLLVTGYVVGLTTIAPFVGPQLTGLLSPFPLYGLVLASFGQRFGGAPAAIHVMRGLVAGLFSCATFFCVMAATIEQMLLWRSCALSIGTMTLVQGITLWMIRKGWV